MMSSQGSELRSALYNWPAKIEHWPADLQRSNMYLKTRPYFVLCLVLPAIGRPMLIFGRPIVKCTPKIRFRPLSSPSASASTPAADHLSRRQRQCLSHEGSGNARQRQCLGLDGSGSARQRQCFGYDGSGNATDAVSWPRWQFQRNRRSVLASMAVATQQRRCLGQPNKGGVSPQSNGSREGSPWTCSSQHKLEPLSSLLTRLAPLLHPLSPLSSTLSLRSVRKQECLLGWCSCWSSPVSQSFFSCSRSTGSQWGSKSPKTHTSKPPELHVAGGTLKQRSTRCRPAPPLSQRGEGRGAKGEGRGARVERRETRDERNVGNSLPPVRQSFGGERRQEGGEGRVGAAQRQREREHESEWQRKSWLGHLPSPRQPVARARSTHAGSSPSSRSGSGMCCLSSSSTRRELTLMYIQNTMPCVHQCVHPVNVYCDVRNVGEVG